MIPLNKPYLGKAEERAIVRALKQTLGTGDGPNTKAMTAMLKKITGSRYVYPVTSCTHGLELILAGMGVGPGDEVIIPSFTMSSTANAVYLRGATPVFADIESTNFNIDPDDIERVITKKTRGMMIVHYAGMPCQMERINAIAKKHKLFVTADAAHVIGARYKRKALGTLTHAAAFSFHGTKNISCGEGGAVLTDDKNLAQTMEIFRANGTNRNAFLRGEVDKYSWVGPGTSFFLSDILAAVAVEQLKKLDTITKKRRRVAAFYTERLVDYTDRVQLPTVPKYTEPNWHIYALKFFKKEHRNIFMDKMREKGIAALMHYVPLHSAPHGRKLGGMRRKLPVTDDVADTLVRLPIYPDLTRTQLHTITKEAIRILKSF